MKAKDIKSWSGIVREACNLVGVKPLKIYSETLKSVDQRKVKAWGIEPSLAYPLLHVLMYVGGYHLIELVKPPAYKRHQHQPTVLSLYARYPGNSNNNQFSSALTRLSYIQGNPVLLKQLIGRKPSDTVGKTKSRFATPVPKPQKPHHVPKARLAKCKPGTWLHVRWNDAPDSVVLLLDRMRREKGEQSLRCLDPVRGDVNYKVVNTQVVEIVGPLHVPKLVPGSVCQCPRCL